MCVLAHDSYHIVLDGFIFKESFGGLKLPGFYNAQNYLLLQKLLILKFKNALIKIYRSNF